MKKIIVAFLMLVVTGAFAASESAQLPKIPIKVQGASAPSAVEIVESRKETASGLVTSPSAAVASIQQRPSGPMSKHIEEDGTESYTIPLTHVTLKYGETLLVVVTLL